MGYTPTFERKITVDGINAKTVANTLIWTNNGDSDFVVLGGVIRCTAASSISSGPTIGIGTASGTNDILLPVGITALNANRKVFNFSQIGMTVAIPVGGTIYLNLSGAATGTSQTISIDIAGFWL